MLQLAGMPELAAAAPSGVQGPVVKYLLSKGADPNSVVMPEYGGVENYSLIHWWVLPALSLMQSADAARVQPCTPVCNLLSLLVGARGHTLTRSSPVHLAAGTACVAITIW
jgi:hypothetical protein